jgi:16S rRNA (cytosine967-C5)-methyltransferase
MPSTASELRLATIPWSALRGIAPLLDVPLDSVWHGAPAEKVLDKFLRANRGFTADERQVAAESVFGIALWRIRLEHTCGSSASPREWVEALQRIPTASPPPDDRVRYSVPQWLWEIFVREVGAEAAALSDAINLPGPVCLRANALHTDRDRLAQRLRTENIETRPTARAAHGLVVISPRPNLFGSAAWRAGMFEVQDEGSQLLAELLQAQPGEAVLDLCAGAGGKSLALAAAVGPKGRVHVADPDLERLDRLRTRAERARCGNLVFAGAHPPADLRVARVLVDAPCSDLGALRRGPDLRHRIQPADFADLPARQLEIASRAVSHLSPEGRLVYATCTLRREENEEVVEALLARHPALRRAREDLRLWPHRDGTDGFYAAALELTERGS